MASYYLYLSSTTNRALQPKPFLHSRRRWLIRLSSIVEGIPYLLASRREVLGVSQSPMWPISLSTRAMHHAWVKPYLTQLANAPQSIPRVIAETIFQTLDMRLVFVYPVLASVSRCLSSLLGRVTTCYSPVRRSLVSSSFSCKH